MFTVNNGMFWHFTRCESQVCQHINYMLPHRLYTVYSETLTQSAVQKPSLRENGEG